jgi:hypothetical protein
LFNACRRDGGEILLSQPPGEFHDGPCTSAVVNIAIEPNDNVFSLEQIEGRRVLVEWNSIGHIETGA